MGDTFPYVPLEALATITMGQSPDSDRVNGEENGLPFLQGCADFGRRFPNPRAYCSPPLRVARQRSTLISVRAPVGTINQADQDYCIGRGLGAVLARPDVADDYFLLNAILVNVDYLHRRSQGSTFLAISYKDLSCLSVPSPARGVQSRIAEILSTVDEAIEQTEALIAKYQQIKAGLMHDLFTRGVTPDGRLRPPRDQAPHLYKESPLGWIPKEWGVRPCAQVCEMITVGIVIRPAQYYVAEGIPAFRSANIRETGIDLSDLVYIAPHSNAFLAKSQVQPGDVLTVRTGYPGTSAVVPPEFAGANCVDVLISRPRPSVVLPDFLASWINSSFGKDQVLRTQGGLAQQHFNVGELRDLLVILPEMSEQVGIVGRLAAVSNKLGEERSLVEKSQQRKNGLMHDLLTGRVRVPIPEVEEALVLCP
ncbi:MAG: restriction endonuclease subunit S [Candidatus Hydrogenedentes bacterium]|nr:restriction endonuclease subunit S [Candidatus Hydrogenedentota bacterium]